MKDVQSRVHIENINKYIKLAPLPWERGWGEVKITKSRSEDGL